VIAVDWVVASSIVTAVATLVLAIATFLSVRSANRAARAAERSLLAGLRPLLATSRLDDAEQKIGFADGKWFHLAGGGAVAEVGDDAIYLLISCRNVGSGIAVLHGWCLDADAPSLAAVEHPPLEAFTRLTRDIFIAQGELGFWQGALRDPSAPAFADARRVIEERQRFVVDVLYGDHELGQRSITRFSVSPRQDAGWLATVARHWNVDRPDPR
jgi:hypothetical protein